MKNNCKNLPQFFARVLTTSLLIVPLLHAQSNNAVDGNNGTIPTPPGLYVTPVAPLTNAVQQKLNPGLQAYPSFVAGGAQKAALSPDATTVAILTAGHNGLYNSTGATDTANSTQYLFLYDVTNANKTKPLLKQVIKQNNSHMGLVWSPDSKTIFAAGGCDDRVYVYTASGSTFTAASPINLGHDPKNGCFTRNGTAAGTGLSVYPNASGLALSADGKTLVVANNYNDSISVVDTATATVRYEYDLRPFAASGAADGTKGGTFPLAVALVGTTAYVGCDRDREVVAVNISGATAGAFLARIALDGNPNGMTVNADGSALYVAQDNADQVAVISTASNTVTARIDTRGPASLNFPAKTTGASPIAVTLNRANNTLYAVNAGSNSIAVIPLGGSGAPVTTGLIPTAYDPTDIAFSGDGSWMYIINGKSDTGPNPGYGFGSLASVRSFTFPGGNDVQAAANRANNQYQFQLENSTLVSAAVPAIADLASLTTQVAKNNGYAILSEAAASDAAVMRFLRDRIQHIIYIVKENRTFDQILGDLGNGSNGDPLLTLFGRDITPSFHRMARSFVTLDNFMDPGDGSMDGWSWAMRGRVTNTETVTQQINYSNASRGLSYEGEGSNRNVPSNLDVANRDAYFDATGATKPYSQLTSALKGGTLNVLAGDGDHAATDSPVGYQQGYIFNVVLDAGLTVRNYGWLANTPGAIVTSTGKPIADPFAAGVIQTTTANQLLSKNNYYDPYFRAYDQAYPDLWRFNEWNREFQQFVKSGNLPALSMIRGMSHDHTGSFSTALGGVNTPELQQADNDYAVGRLVETVANSPYANNTLIIITEDDCQDGGDHVDSHRATTYIVGPYVKRRAVINTRYSQPNVLRTIEDILGTKHLNLNTYYARPMADVFDVTSSGQWNFHAVASTLLKTTRLDLTSGSKNVVEFAPGPDLKPTHDAAYWAAKTRGMDFSIEDRVPAARYNKILWEGMKGTKAPKPHSQFRRKKADQDGDGK